MLAFLSHATLGEDWKLAALSTKGIKVLIRHSFQVLPRNTLSFWNLLPLARCFLLTKDVERPFSIEEPRWPLFVIARDNNFDLIGGTVFVYEYLGAKLVARLVIWCKYLNVDCTAGRVKDRTSMNDVDRFCVYTFRDIGVSIVFRVYKSSDFLAVKAICLRGLYKIIGHVGEKLTGACSCNLHCKYIENAENLAEFDHCGKPWSINDLILEREQRTVGILKVLKTLIINLNFFRIYT